MAAKHDSAAPAAAPQASAAQGTLASEQFKAAAESKIETMRVKVFSPSKIFFDEQAVSISAENPTGVFDVLPRHHAFITLLEPCELEVRRAGGQDSQRIKISGGLMHVKSNVVTVFLDV